MAQGFCKDCKYSRTTLMEGIPVDWECHHPSVKKECPVTGTASGPCCFERNKEHACQDYEDRYVPIRGERSWWRRFIKHFIQGYNSEAQTVERLTPSKETTGE